MSDRAPRLPEGGAAFHRRLRGDGLPEAVGGDGACLIDSNGRRYLDGSSGTGISCLGHSSAEVRAAIHRQVDSLAFAHTSFFTNEPMERLAADLTATLPGASVWFTTSGAEAVEASLKLARQYFLEAGEPDRTWIIGRRGGYLGASLGALSAGGSMNRRKAFEPLLFENVRHIAPCFPYREMRPGEGAAAYALRAANDLEETIQHIGASHVAAFIAETVIGSSLGAVAAPAGYFRRIREICDRHGVLLLLDEVMCGMARTGTRFAFEQERIVPDMVMIGKGLAGGYAPLGATIVGAKVREALTVGSGAFRHGHSAHGHALACATGLAVQQEIARADLLPQVRRKGERLHSLLRERFADHPHVGDIRGRGLFLALEFVHDKSTREPFDPAMQLHARLKQQALEGGLICYPSSGTVDGVRGDHVMIMPPFITSDSQLEELVDKLAVALDASIAAAGPTSVER